VRRYDGIIVVRTTYDNSPMAIWNFQRGLPLKVVGPNLNAQTGEVAIEELQIVHEGLTLHSTDPAARGQA
jgi:phage tail-like protein